MELRWEFIKERFHEKRKKTHFRPKIRFKKTRKKTRSLPRKQERKNDLGQEKKKVAKISTKKERIFINSNLRSHLESKTRYKPQYTAITPYPYPYPYLL